jgi:hypothetical protein
MTTLAIDVLLASEAEAYLTAFDARFVNAPIGDAKAYLDRYMYTPAEGVEERVRTVRFPIPLRAAELKLFTGRRRFRKGSTRYIEVKKRPYQDGEAVFYKLISDPAWTGFNTAPEVLRKICAAWPTQQGANIINTGETIAHWKGTYFLSASTPSNPFKKASSPRTYKTFWNATTLTHDNVQAMIGDMVNRRDMEDRPFGFVGTTVFCSAALWPTAMSVCMDERLANGETNPIRKYNLQVELWADLSPTRWGMLHAGALGEYPIFNALIGADELQTYDRTSAMFEQKAEMGYDIMKDLGIAAARNEALSVADTTDVL